jgi:hypothetical protein
MTWKNKEAWKSIFRSNHKMANGGHMNKNEELKAAFILWKKLCELENLLFDHYSDAFTDLHMEEEQEKQGLQKDFEWPF